jgi:poly(3-hydroxybutyrate) depolymerase
MKVDHVQGKVGHYGVFNGSRYRSEIQPRMREFMRQHWDVERDRAARVPPRARTLAAE